MNPFPVTETNEPVKDPVSPTSNPSTSPAPVVSSPAPVVTPEPMRPPVQYEYSGTGGVGTYLPEYVVQLILLIVIVSSITSLFGIGIDNLIPAEKSSSASDYGTQISSFSLVWSLAGLLSALPLFGFLFWRTRKVESNYPEVKDHKWRRGFLGAFLVIEGLAIVSVINGLLFDLIGRAVDVDSMGLFSYFSSGEKGPWWEAVMIALLSLAVLSFVVFVMSRDFRKSEG